VLPESVTFGASTPIKELQKNFGFAAVISPPLYTHIDDLVESLRVITPRGLIETRRNPP
jgi:hypothetical protein